MSAAECNDNILDIFLCLLQINLQKFFSFLRTKIRFFFCMSDDTKNAVLHVAK